VCAAPYADYRLAASLKSSRSSRDKIKAFYSAAINTKLAALGRLGCVRGPYFAFGIAKQSI
jgi:hypothetical protein